MEFHQQRAGVCHLTGVLISLRTQSSPSKLCSIVVHFIQCHVICKFLTWLTQKVLKLLYAFHINKRYLYILYFYYTIIFMHS